MNSEYNTEKFLTSLENFGNISPDIIQIHPKVFHNTIDFEITDLEGPSDSENDDFTFLKLLVNSSHEPYNVTHHFDYLEYLTCYMKDGFINDLLLPLKSFYCWCRCYERVLKYEKLLCK